MATGGQTAQTVFTPVRYSKRKRTTVDYREEELSDDNVEFVGNGGDVMPTFKSKKQKTTAPKPLPKRKIFPFLQLPAEIRNQIYKICLTDPAGVYLRPTTKAFRRTVHRVSESTYRSPRSSASSSLSAPSKQGHADGSASTEQDSQEEEQDLPSVHTQTFVPALLAANKQIYQEGREILYGNDFYMGDTMTMHSFLVDIGARAASLLKCVTLIHWGEGRGVNKAYNHAAFTALSTATNLERFIMHGHTSYRQAPRPVAIQFYRDAFPWLEAVGTAKGKADAAVHLINMSDDEFIDIRRRRWWRYRNHKYTGYDQIESFRKELARLLNARMDMIRS